jgi:eukaryotic-like serine/threonine-protein kinase
MKDGASLGAYQVVRRLGAGGMGEVWEARHSLLGRSAAIKVLHPNYSSEPEIVARFFNEAKAAAAIADPGIVQIFDFGHHSDGSAYIVMEMLRGETLEHRLRRSGPLRWADALRLVRQIASALAAAHDRGIVHRDLKPENLFVVADPEVIGGERIKVVDFGIAKLVGDDSVKTQTSAVMGTPLFMSPEQCRGAGRVEQRSDVYSLGCVLFALLTGGPPFCAAGAGEIIAMQLREPAPPPSHRAPGLPMAVDQLTLQCLEKEPSHRPSMTALAMRIDYILGSLGALESSDRVPPSMSRVAAVVHGGPPTTLAPSVASAANARSRSTRAAYVSAAAGLVMLAGVGGWVALRGRTDLRASATVTIRPDAALMNPPPQDDRSSVALAHRDPADGIAELQHAATIFRSWAKEHAEAACPDSTALGLTADPWGQPLRVTCDSQPLDQVIGITSSGADKLNGTADDLMSWRVEEVRELLLGARWSPATPPRRRRVKQQERPIAEHKRPADAASDSPTPRRGPAPRPAARIDTDGDGIPDVR